MICTLAITVGCLKTLHVGFSSSIIFLFLFVCLCYSLCTSSPFLLLSLPNLLFLVFSSIFIVCLSQTYPFFFFFFRSTLNTVISYRTCGSLPLSTFREKYLFCLVPSSSFDSFDSSWLMFLSFFLNKFLIPQFFIYFTFKNSRFEMVFFFSYCRLKMFHFEFCSLLFRIVQKTSTNVQYFITCS